MAFDLISPTGECRSFKVEGSFFWRARNSYGGLTMPQLFFLVPPSPGLTCEDFKQGHIRFQSITKLDRPSEFDNFRIV